MSAEPLTSRDVARALGIGIATVQRWMLAGVRPSIRPSRKQGCPALWSSADLDALRRMIEMRRLADSDAAVQLVLANPSAIVVAGPKGTVVVARRRSVPRALRRVGSPALVL